jgi:hypothetical protein
MKIFLASEARNIRDFYFIVSLNTVNKNIPAELKFHFLKKKLLF